MQTQVKTNRITEGVIWKELLLFAIPVMLGFFFQQLYNTVDAIVVGRFVSKQALAAVGGSTGTIINLMIGLFNGLAGGATVLISQFYGAGKYEQTNRALHSAYAIALAGGAFLALAGYFLSGAALRAVSVPEDVYADALVYMRIYFLGSVFSLVYNMASGIIRAMGDSKRPLYFLIASAFFNIVVDLLLVAVFRMGVVGAALATVVSQAFSAVLCTVYLLRAQGPYRLDFRKLGFARELSGEIVRLGLPMGFQSALYSISNIIIQSSVNSFGTDAAAAWTAFGKLDGFFWMMVSSFGIAVTTFSGQNFGAGKYERIHETVRSGLLMSFICSAVMSVVMNLFGASLLTLFTDDPSVILLGEEMIRHMTPFYFTYLGVEIYAGAVRGTGDTFVPTIFTVFGICILRAVIVFFILPVFHTTVMIELTYPITWAVTSICFIVYYYFSGWLERSKQRRGISD